MQIYSTSDEVVRVCVFSDAELRAAENHYVKLLPFILHIPLSHVTNLCRPVVSVLVINVVFPFSSKCFVFA